MPPEHLFVYGLLRPNAAPPEIRPLLANAVDLGAATVIGDLLDVRGEYPAAVPGKGTIHGRVLRWDGAVDWKRLDRWEGCDRRPPLYRRARVVARLARGGAADAWIYWFARPTDGLTPILGGRWRP